MSDRNEWFKDVKRLIRGLEVETVEDPFACPTVKSVTDGEDVLHALGLHPSRDVCGIVNVDIDEVYGLIRHIEPEPVTGSTSDGYHTFDELYHHRAVLFSVMKLRRQFAIVAQEVWVDPDHRVDFVAFSPGSGGRNAALEHGKFVFVEVKSCMADFKSGHGLTFLGDENWLVCPRDLAHELYDERLLPFGVQVYCPDNGGALRLTYDLRMQAAKSLREDSTLCLLWAMLMDSYSRWRTTWDVFNETGESYDL